MPKLEIHSILNNLLIKSSWMSNSSQQRRPVSSATPAIARQKQLHDTAYTVISQALDAEQAGHFKQAANLYREGLGALNTALQLEFTERDARAAGILHEKMDRNRQMIKERLAEVMQKSNADPVRRVSTRSTSQAAPTSPRMRNDTAPNVRPLLKHVDAKLANMILDEVLVEGQNTTFDDIAGLDSAKQTIKELVIFPALRPDLYTGLRSPARGLLLFGPPGTGKTLLAKAIAHESKSKFFAISASTLVSKWMGESEKLVRTLFEMAKQLQPSVIFIDEVDSMLSARKSEGEHEASRRLKTEFLVQFDGIGVNADKERVLVVAASNRPQELDEAARRRFTKRIYIPLPEAQTRQKLLCTLLRKQKSTLNVKQLEKLVLETDGYSCSDLTALAKQASLYPLKSLTPEQIMSIHPSKVRFITYKDFVSAMQDIRPSVSPDELLEVERWAKDFGSAG